MIQNPRTEKDAWFVLLRNNDKLSQKGEILSSEPFATSFGNLFQNSLILIAKFRLKLKKVGKATRPYRYDLNQIPYDYTVEVRNLRD